VIIPYTGVPDDVVGWPRPLVDIVVSDVDEARFPCLVDSGALNALLPRALAMTAGIDLRRRERRELGVAGAATTACFVTTRLTLEDYSWETEVGFCHPWPYGWGLLGQRSFFRYFTVTFRAADFEFELEPVDM